MISYHHFTWLYNFISTACSESCSAYLVLIQLQGFTETDASLFSSVLLWKLKYCGYRDMWHSPCSTDTFLRGKFFSSKPNQSWWKLFQEVEAHGGQWDPPGSIAAFLETEIAHTFSSDFCSLSQGIWITSRVEHQRNNLFNEE